MDEKSPIQIQPRIEDSPEFWLGQVAQVVQMERKNKLTRTKAYTAIKDLMKRVNQYQNSRQMRELQMLRMATQKGKL